MSANLERPNRIPWPPLLYGSAILAAVGAQFLFPLGFAWIPHPFSDILFAIGWVIIDSSIWVAVMTGTPSEFEQAMMSFCARGTFSGGS